MPKKKQDEQTGEESIITAEDANISDDGDNLDNLLDPQAENDSSEEKTSDETVPSDGTEKNEDVLAEQPEPVTSAVEPSEETQPENNPPAEEKPKPARTRKKTIYDLNLNELDRNLSPEERQEWSSIYASFRSKSVLTSTAIGADQNKFDIFNRETKEVEKKTLHSLIILDYRVKILIPESEMWIPGEERPVHVLRNMVGSKIDYVILDIDREGEWAVASRRLALTANRSRFRSARNARTAPKEGDRLKCNVLAVGAKRCLVECGGYDIVLSQRDLSYTSIADLREKYRPGQELECVLKSYDRATEAITISVKEVKPNPFVGADKRHPVGSRRQAVISGKYGGGVFCTLPDDTVCLCLYTPQLSDEDFNIGDSVIIVIRQYDFDRQLIYGRILTNWS